MTTESVKLDRAIVRRLRRYSKNTGISISRLANRILKHGMDHPDVLDAIWAESFPKSPKREE